MKHCSVCNQDKPIIEFYKGANGKARGFCKVCYNRKIMEWQKSSGKDSRLRSLKKYRTSNKYKKTAQNLRTTLHSRFKAMEYSSKNKNFSSDITESHYTLLVGAPCTYCTGPLPESGIGLDRIDDLKGYTLDNVLPCCSECNRIRSDVYTVEEMKTIIGPAIRKLRELRNQNQLLDNTPR